MIYSLVIYLEWKRNTLQEIIRKARWKLLQKRIISDTEGSLIEQQLLFAMNTIDLNTEVEEIVDQWAKISKSVVVNILL